MKTKSAVMTLMQFLITFIMLPTILFSESAVAQYGIALGYGINSNMFSYRLSLQVDSSLNLDNYLWPATGYWEGSAIYIASKRNWHNNIGGLALAYVFHFEKKDLYCRKNIPYAELGIGGALFNKKGFLERNFGSSGLFEVKLGAGIRLGQFKEYDISYKFIHYSNAFLKQPNDGLNFNFIVFSYLF